jgi:hypothetical protein
MNDELNRCPFCDAPPSAGSDFHYHPTNDCILSGFEISAADGDKWNRRDLRDPLAVVVTLGDRMYVDSSMQYHNGTLMLTVKGKPRESKENPS